MKPALKMALWGAAIVGVGACVFSGVPALQYGAAAVIVAWAVSDHWRAYQFRRDMERRETNNLLRDIKSELGRRR